MEYTIEQLQNILQAELSNKRYRHCLAVAKQARKLACRYKVSAQQAVLAGLLHDVSKELPMSDQLKILSQCDTISKSYLKNEPNIFHSVTGAWMVQKRFEVTDQDVLNAITYHTTARSGMSRLEKIIYVADKTSLDRRYEGVDYYRKLSFEHLDRCLFLLLRDILQFLVKQQHSIPQDTVDAYHAYRV